MQRIVRDEWPLHLNGQRYTDELYLEEWAARNWTLGPGDYHAINAFNAEPDTDYNRSSTWMASTSADDWYNFPNMTGSRTDNNCEAWGCDGYGYLKWWYDHMPHVAGVKNGLLNNWWRYVIDPDQYKANWQFLSPAEFDFAENNADQWDCWADLAECMLVNSTQRLKAGSSSVKFSTTGAFDTAVQYPASGIANWDLTDKTYFTFWAFAENSNEPGFQNNSPIAYLFNPRPPSPVLAVDAGCENSIPVCIGASRMRAQFYQDVRLAVVVFAVGMVPVGGRDTLVSADVHGF